jgi:hypothetical protein
MKKYIAINGYDNNYEINNLGNVRNTKNGIILKSRVNKGYKQVRLRESNQKYTNKFVHRLIAEAFIPNPHKKPFVDHLDNNKANNNMYNLRWATSSENNRNVGLSSQNTSGVKGVMRCYGKWLAYINVDGKQITIGRYEKIEDAKDARQKKATEVFGIFTNRIERIKTDIELLEDELNNL